MIKSKLSQLYVKKVFNVARALPRYHVSLSLERDRKGVSA